MDVLNVENAGAFFCLAQIFHKIRAQLIFLGLKIISKVHPLGHVPRFGIYIHTLFFQSVLE